MTPANETATPAPDRLQRLEWLSRLLDTAFSIPGTRFRIGLDAILGLIPGIGDPLGAVLSSYIIVEAARLGAPKHTLLRMIGNVAVESLVGLVPILGDVFDIVWKANARNVALLRAHPGQLRRQERSQQQVLWLIAAVVLLIIVGLAAVSLLVLRFFYQMITA